MQAIRTEPVDEQQEHGRIQDEEAGRQQRWTPISAEAVFEVLSGHITSGLAVAGLGSPPQSGMACATTTAAARSGQPRQADPAGP